LQASTTTIDFPNDGDGFGTETAFCLGATALVFATVLAALVTFFGSALVDGAFLVEDVFGFSSIGAAAAAADCAAAAAFLETRADRLVPTMMELDKFY